MGDRNRSTLELLLTNRMAQTAQADNTATTSPYGVRARTGLRDLFTEVPQSSIQDFAINSIERQRATTDPRTGLQLGAVEAGGLEAVDVIPISWIRKLGGASLAAGALGMAGRRTPTQIIRQHFDEYTRSRNAWEDVTKMKHSAGTPFAWKPTEERAGEILNILYPRYLVNRNPKLTNLENLKEIVTAKLRRQQMRDDMDNMPSLAEKIGEQDDIKAGLRREGMETPSQPAQTSGKPPNLTYAQWEEVLRNANVRLQDRLKNEGYSLKMDVHPQMGTYEPGAGVSIITFVKGTDPVTRRTWNNWEQAGSFYGGFGAPKKGGLFEDALPSRPLPINPPYFRMSSAAPFANLQNKAFNEYEQRFRLSPHGESWIPFRGAYKKSPQGIRPGYELYDALHNSLKELHGIHLRSGNTGLSPGSLSLWQKMVKENKAFNLLPSLSPDESIYLMRMLGPIGLGTGLLQYRGPELDNNNR